jgi:hypothetical protein
MVNFLQFCIGLPPTLRPRATLADVLDYRLLL